MINWEVVNKVGVSVNCANEEETIKFLQECERKEIPWWFGGKATDASPDHRTISTNNGKFLTAYERKDDEIIEFQSVFILTAENNV